MSASAMTGREGLMPRRGLGERVARWLIFGYGLVAYAAFLAAFLYVMGFLTGWFVPKAINDGPVGPVWVALLVNSAFLGAFAVQHAIMARSWFRRWITSWMPAAMERSTFVLAASAILLLMYWQWRPMPGYVWHVETPRLRAVIYAVCLGGFGIVLLSSFMINHFDLFGLRQVYLRLKAKAYEPVPFRLTALYRMVRHPLMVGFLIAFWATPDMTWGHLLFAGLTTGYIFVGVQMEERDLVRAHGDSYREYKRRVGGFVPRVMG